MYGDDRCNFDHDGQVEKVKRRREEREKELAWMEEEKARMLRSGES